MILPSGQIGHSDVSVNESIAPDKVLSFNQKYWAQLFKASLA